MRSITGVPVNHDRYAYEQAEAVLDAFMRGVSSSGLHRAYYRLKTSMVAYLLIDLAPSETLTAQHIAWAWEDLDLAFRGHGDPVMTGHVLHLWSHLQGAPKKAFRKVLKKAFARADTATGDGVPRRYHQRWRKKKILRGDHPFDLPTIIPTFGPRVRDWAQETGRDWRSVEQEFRWAEFLERGAPDAQASRARRPRGQLRLVPEQEV